MGSESLFLPNKLSGDSPIPDPAAQILSRNVVHGL